MQRRNHSLRLPLPARRPAILRRNASSSSEASHASHASPRSLGSEDQFVFSPAHTPSTENPSSRVRVQRYTTDPSVVSTLLMGREVIPRPRDSETIPTTANHLRITPSSRSRPIPIQAPRVCGSGPTPTAASIPPEPLSARGDRPGGYFPLHEDPKSRVHIPHPFHLDSEMARKNSLRRAAEFSKSGANSKPSPPVNAFGSAEPPLQGQPSGSDTADTPISSYIPSGHHEDVVLLMGKYYPSNWEKRHGKAPQDRPSAMTQPNASVIRSEPQIPRYQGGQGHHRRGSDVKRRLQQYQRDMVAQAAMAASALIASSGSAHSAAAASLSGVSLPKVQLAANFLKTHKPLSPKLRPVGSPGPVTPMSLEAESYLSLRSPAGGMDAESPEDGNGDRESRRKQWRKDPVSSPLELSAVSV
ncbi:hypothetical protein N657DRAFT_643989 [Parathielavia appendiculata]|uniref:Uncharacterized protein n=1 Tax=Parathielavia appendiculata TaxID=2587402 RepID=A0AAN6U2B1_9PEZI|nr:hypothetical protein N657DRAFT_643989 [Parathielavia appendiculata]